tara:strand:+ start:152 stop:658 length:507 start_codon:yes stop_codon:yes gene_type:complete
MKINIVPYSDEWPLLFEIIKKEIKKSIVDNDFIIEHIGSTSVKKLASKPIIDILIGVRSDELDKYIDPIKNLGYTHIKEYEIEIPDRRFFFFEKSNKRIAHIHLVKQNSKWFKRHIAFRNELRVNKIIRKKYQRLKYSLAEKEWKDGNEYADAKTTFIRAVEKTLKFD